MGNIPLSVAQDAPQFNFVSQSSNQVNPSNEQFPLNPTQPIGFIEPSPVPGFAQQVTPYGHPPVTSPYPQQAIIPAQNTVPYVQPSLYPQPQTYNQSQLPYPDVNIQQPAFNPSYQNPNLEGVSTLPTAPSI